MRGRIVPSNWNCKSFNFHQANFHQAEVTGEMWLAKVARQATLDSIE